MAHGDAAAGRCGCRPHAAAGQPAVSAVCNIVDYLGAAAVTQAVQTVRVSWRD